MPTAFTMLACTSHIVEQDSLLQAAQLSVAMGTVTFETAIAAGGAPAVGGGLHIRRKVLAERRVCDWPLSHRVDASLVHQSPVTSQHDHKFSKSTRAADRPLQHVSFGNESVESFQSSCATYRVVLADCDLWYDWAVVEIFDPGIGMSSIGVR
jgi:hypothetical protein